jgi:hypothetical protein
MGNQMFQYATARAAANRNGVPLLVDTTLFDGAELRPYRLNLFDLSARAAHASGIPRALFRLACTQKPGLGGLAAALRRRLGIELIIESMPHRVDPLMESLRVDGTVCLQGYWQCPRYFAADEDLIRREFDFKDPLSPASAVMLEQILRANAISLHVRRGDYLALTNSPVLPPAYYHRAFETIVTRVPDPELFIFSDDIGWARENLHFQCKTTFVNTASDANAHEDMRLMAACRHHIIANSSFSWWGAWLNPRRDKIVAAPRYWMCRSDTCYPDLFPEEWTCVDNLT